MAKISTRAGNAPLTPTLTMGPRGTRPKAALLSGPVIGKVQDYHHRLAQIYFHFIRKKSMSDQSQNLNTGLVSRLVYSVYGYFRRILVKALYGSMTDSRSKYCRDSDWYCETDSSNSFRLPVDDIR